MKMKPDFNQQIVQALPELKASIAKFAPKAEMVEDILHDTVVRALEANNKGQWDGSSNMGGWLYMIARRIVASHWRQASQRGKYMAPADHIILDMVEDNTNVESQALARIQLEHVAQHVMFDLTGPTQRVVMLAALRGEEVEDICGLTGKSRKWIVNAMGEARKRLIELQDWRN